MTTDSADLVTRRKRSLGPAYRLFYERPVHIVRGEGVWLYDDVGRRYLDMYNNVPHVGHCHPRVVDAICVQQRTLNTHTRYLHENVVLCAERLLEKFEPELDTAMFACTGSEANELALRIARSVTGRRGVIVAEFAYHGNSQATFEISVEDYPASERPAHIATIPFPDVYRSDRSMDDAAAHFASFVPAAIDQLRAGGEAPAALIVDTILSSSGTVVTPPGYLAALAKAIREAGGVFIADEVQPGFGRTGEHFWGYQADSFVPDIVTMGKPMGNGHPVSAVVTRRELVAEFAARGSYFNTFGGNPVSSAAALAVLEVIDEEGLQQNALDVGSYINEKLRELADRYPLIGDIRGKGLFIAVDLVTDRESKNPATAEAAAVVNGLKERGVLIGAVGPGSNVLKFRSPMVICRDDADFMLERLHDVLAEVQAS